MNIRQLTLILNSVSIIQLFCLQENHDLNDVIFIKEPGYNLLYPGSFSVIRNYILASYSISIFCFKGRFFDEFPIMIL